MRKTNRRTLLKGTASSIGLAIGGSSVLGTVSACDEPSGNFSTRDDYYYVSNLGDSTAESKCESGFNSGTRMDMGTSCYYWGSSTEGGHWTHYFSNHAHAEHFEENNCSWEHQPGIDNHRWRGNSHDSINDITQPDNKDKTGVFPETTNSESFDYANYAFTGMTTAVGKAWPASAPAMTAAQIVYGLAFDRTSDSSPGWEKSYNWPYNSPKQCASHYNRYYVTSDQGAEGKFDLVTSDVFSNPYFYVSVSSKWDSENPICDNGCDSSTTTELSETTMSNSTLEEKQIDIPESGEIVEAPNGKVAEIKKANRKTERSNATGAKPVDKEEFKKHHPQKAKEDGVPDQLVGLPLTVTTTKEVGRYLNPEPPEA